MSDRRKVSRREFLRRGRSLAGIAAPFIVPSGLLSAPGRPGPKGRIEFRRNDGAGQLEILIDGKESLTYCYGPAVDLPHYYPVRSPSGKSLTVQKTEPYPHHRSIWFADSVQLEGKRKVSFYSALYSKMDPEDPKSPFRDRIRQAEFLPEKYRENQAECAVKLLWEMDLKVPVLDERRDMRIVALGDGEYFVDLEFTLMASYGDVLFDSDWIHYGWPFVRMSPEFSVDKGGIITSSEGGVNQKETNGKPARWMDYSNTIGGQAEGLAVFSHPQNGYPHKWLTRDYGTFGPRRIDEKSGKKFTLKRGEKIAQRVGILIHRGDVKGGKVAERYQSYITGGL